MDLEMSAKFYETIYTCLVVSYQKENVVSNLHYPTEDSAEICTGMLELF